jgi:hypothetical protein
MSSQAKENRFETIRKKISSFPTGPGLYFMKGPRDKVLYIGKAKNLRARAASYFQQAADLAVLRGPKITEMLGKVKTVDFLETKTEVQAVLAEARLIKDIHPPYNTDLVDDKTFPYLEITTSDDFPGAYITRKPRPRGSRLFGPFTGARDLRSVLVVAKYQRNRPQAQVLPALPVIQHKAVHRALRGQNRKGRIQKNHHRPHKIPPLKAFNHPAAIEKADGRGR